MLIIKVQLLLPKTLFYIKELLKHIDIRYFFIREKIDNTMLEMLYVDTKNNLADLFTKPVVLAVHATSSTYLLDESCSQSYHCKQ